MPHWLKWTDAWTARIEAFAKAGGTVILGGRTGSRDVNNHVIRDTSPGKTLSALAGITVEEFGRSDADRRRWPVRAWRPLRRQHGPQEAAGDVGEPPMLHNALQEAVRKRLIRSNPCSAATPPSARSARPPEFNTWTAEQLVHFFGLSAVRQDPLFAAIWVAAMTGMRQGEVGLRWRHVDLDAGGLRVKLSRTMAGRKTVESSPKSDTSRRWGDLDPKTCTILRRHRAKHDEVRQAIGMPCTGPDDYVSGSFTGEAPWPNALGDRFRRLVRATDLPYPRFHDLRHSHGTVLMRAQVNVKVVQERLGHQSPGFTIARYVHTSRDDHRAAASKIGTLNPTREDGVKNLDEVAKAVERSLEEAEQRHGDVLALIAELRSAHESLQKNLADAVHLSCAGQAVARDARWRCGCVGGGFRAR